ncbi:MAG TPA: hypothetical protein ENG83_00915 [Nitrospirae bacterium]|nr:chromate resistance exported protein [bacterium BMS3Abin06]HDH10764.1 hypothetical protein [Nitrospirota bacterium]HDZ03052.1 hypothetical protein [Nitrospirota bacterium]
MKTITPRELFFSIFFILFVIVAYAGPDDVHAEEKPLVFSTWEGFEVDKCASIWLIKRFVDENAFIKFSPRGEEIKEGIPFDTPDAKLRRYHNMSTFESILKHYNLRDQKLLYIGKIIHDIEVNIWERKALKETLMVQKAVNEIITNSKNNDEIIDKSLKYFDSLYIKIFRK